MKYIIFDLDDTLLNDQRQVSDYTLSVLRRLQAMGHRTVINTARSKSYSQALFDRIQPDYAIFNGGAMIVDSRGTPIFRAELDLATTHAIISQLLTHTDNFSIQTEDAMYSNNGSYTGQNALAFDFARDPFPHAAQKIVASLPEEAPALALAEEFDLAYTSYFSGPFRRFNHRDATKAMGNRNLVRITGGRMEDVLAFGDDLGDLEMLQQAGVGVLMKNARPELDSTGLTRSQFTNDEDGVARFLIHYFGLED